MIITIIIAGIPLVYIYYLFLKEVYLKDKENKKSE